jgi:hypothetical protein
MILDSLKEALTRMADTPVLWITGFYAGALFALDILLQAEGNSVLGARIGFLGLCALPFFLGGSYGAIRGGGAGIHHYIGAGARYYFRILLAGAVIVGAALITAVLVIVPITIMGGSVQATAGFILLGVGIPFGFFSFFYDTAVVFEDRKVLASLRRSVEFVTGNPGAAIGFVLANLAIGILLLLVSVVIWSFTIADRLEPYIGANQTALQNMTPVQMMDLIGVPGLRTGAIIGFFAVMIWGTFVASFKACFFRRVASSSPAPLPEGEFDEKGRWYRF